MVAKYYLVPHILKRLSGPYRRWLTLPSALHDLNELNTWLEKLADSCDDEKFVIPAWLNRHEPGPVPIKPSDLPNRKPNIARWARQTAANLRRHLLDATPLRLGWQPASTR